MHGISGLVNLFVWKSQLAWSVQSSGIGKKGNLSPLTPDETYLGLHGLILKRIICLTWTDQGVFNLGRTHGEKLPTIFLKDV